LESIQNGFSQLLYSCRPSRGKKERVSEARPGTRTVIEYMHAFNHLSRYASGYVDTENTRMCYFMMGLNLKLQMRLSTEEYATYNALVSDAILLDH
jgi:hypothetical protein